MEMTSNSYLFLFIASGVLNKKLSLKNINETILKGTSTKERKITAQSNSSGNIESVKITDHYKTVIYGLSLSHGEFIRFVV